MENINTNTIFTELTDEEAATVSGGGWQRWWEGTRNSRNAARVAFQLATGSVMLPLGLGIRIAERRINSYDSGNIT